MKHTLCLLLALLLLCGCTPTPEPGSAPSASAHPAPAATGAAPVGPEALEAGTVLFYRQADFEARQGVLLPLTLVRSAPEEALLPRTHVYDELFPGDGALLLRLLDYALANGYQGFSVPAGTLPTPDAKQYRALEFTYWIDGGGILSSEKDGCLTFWHSCQRDDEMEKFSLGLAAAREIAAQAPRGDDWETTAWIISWLAEHVAYGERTPYYFKRGHMLCDALVDRNCLCSGYANALYYLCSLCGIECLNVFGLSRAPDKPGGLDDHLWNYVRIYGSWYVCDPTMNAVSQLGGPPVAIGLSAETMYLLGGNKPTGAYTDASLIPACETNFDPVTAWNATPEGALRSWLWFAGYDALEPTFLLLQAGLMTGETERALSDDGETVALDIPWADFSAWADRFMRPEARAELPIRFSEAEDGGLLLRRSETDTRSFFLSLELRAVTDKGEGTWSADLGTASADFSLSQNADGLYRIETIQLTPHE